MDWETQLTINTTWPCQQEPDILHLRTVGLYRVVDVDQDEEDGHQQCHPAGDDLGVDQEAEIKF